MSNARDTAKNLKTGLNVAAAGSIIDVQKAGSTVGQISNIGNDFVVGSSTGSGAGLRFDGSGNLMYPSNSLGNSRDNAVDLGASSVRFKDLYLSGGAYLGGTGAANYLEDYEEGTWSGSVGSVHGSTQPSVSGGTFTGSYTKIGRVVHVAFYAGPFQMSGTLSSTLAIKGMPFTHGGGDSTNGGVVSTYYITWARPNYVALRIYSGNEAGFLSVNNGANWGWEDCNAAGTGANRYISGTIQYTVA